MMTIELIYSLKQICPKFKHTSLTSGHLWPGVHLKVSPCVSSFCLVCRLPLELAAVVLGCVFQLAAGV